MKSSAHGFTLVELIITMVLIGIIATIAVPRFINLNASSNQSATNAIATSLTAASASNYAQRSANSSAGSAVSLCSSVTPLIAGGLPTGYSIHTNLAVPAGTSVNCKLDGPGSTQATFVAIGIA